MYECIDFFFRIYKYIRSLEAYLRGVMFKIQPLKEPVNF